MTDSGDTIEPINPDLENEANYRPAPGTCRMCGNVRVVRTYDETKLLCRKGMGWISVEGTCDLWEVKGDG